MMPGIGTRPWNCLRSWNFSFSTVNSLQFFFPLQKIRYLQTSTFTSMITIFFPILYQMLRGQIRNHACSAFVRVFVYTLTCQTWARSHVSQTRENASQCRSPGEAFALSLSRWLSLKCVCPTFQSFKCVSPHPLLSTSSCPFSHTAQKNVCTR